MKSTGRKIGAGADVGPVADGWKRKRATSACTGHPSPRTGDRRAPSAFAHRGPARPLGLRTPCRRFRAHLQLSHSVTETSDRLGRPGGPGCFA